MKDSKAKWLTTTAIVATSALILFYLFDYSWTSGIIIVLLVALAAIYFFTGEEKKSMFGKAWKGARMLTNVLASKFLADERDLEERAKILEKQEKLREGYEELLQKLADAEKALKDAEIALVNIPHEQKEAKKSAEAEISQKTAALKAAKLKIDTEETEWRTLKNKSVDINRRIRNTTWDKLIVFITLSLGVLDLMLYVVAYGLWRGEWIFVVPIIGIEIGPANLLIVAIPLATLIIAYAILALHITHDPDFEILERFGEHLYTFRPGFHWIKMPFIDQIITKPGQFTRREMRYVLNFCENRIEEEKRYKETTTEEERKGQKQIFIQGILDLYDYSRPAKLLLVFKLIDPAKAYYSTGNYKSDIFALVENETRAQLYSMNIFDVLPLQGKRLNKSATEPMPLRHIVKEEVEKEDPDRPGKKKIVVEERIAPYSFLDIEERINQEIVPRFGARIVECTLQKVDLGKNLGDLWGAELEARLQESVEKSLEKVETQKGITGAAQMVQRLRHLQEGINEKASKGQKITIPWILQYEQEKDLIEALKEANLFIQSRGGQIDWPMAGASFSAGQRKIREPKPKREPKQRLEKKD